MGWGQLSDTAQAKLAEDDLRDVLSDNVDQALEQVAISVTDAWWVDADALEALINVLAGNLAAAGFRREGSP